MTNHKEMVSWSREHLERHARHLRGLLEIATRRALQVGGEAVQSQVEELEARLAVVRAVSGHRRDWLSKCIRGYPGLAAGAGEGDPCAVIHVAECP